jgi:diadenylate cyclase
MDIIQTIQDYFSQNEWYSWGIEMLLAATLFVLYILAIRRERKALLRAGFLLLGSMLFVINTMIPLPLFTTYFAQTDGIWIIVVVVLIIAEVVRYIDANEWGGSSKALDVNRDVQLIKVITNAVELLRNKKTGALITFERESSLDDIIGDSIPLDAEVTTELLLALFNTKAPTHDGAVIIKGGRIACAGAFYNFADGVVDKTLGSRHRAALGLSQVRDSVTIVVSEETGQVSLAYDGILDRNLNKDSLGITLSNLLGTS